ncbi:MAG: hypothetical protein AB7K41_11415 [Bdellovibrionales bacterium]
MGLKLKATFSLVTAAAAVALLFNNCSPVHTSGSGDFSSLSACQSVLVDGFQRSFYPFLKSNCANCHAVGPGSGFFASNNASLSFSAFSRKTADKISEFATSTHKPPYTGTQHNAAVAGINQSWNVTKAQYAACQTANGDVPDVPTTVTPTKMLIAKNANPNLNQTVNLTWNTGTEFVDAANSYAGGQLVVTVRGVTIAGGPPAYQIENLRFINAGASSAYINGVAVYVNGVKIAGDTYLYVDRYIPNVANNNSRRLAPGANFFPRPVDSPITEPLRIQLAVGVLGASEINFVPTTYTALTNGAGFFATNCVSCHSPDNPTPPGGYNLGPNNYNNVVGRTANSDKTLVTPFTLSDNFIYQRINDPGSPMPPTGLIEPATSRDVIRDWILDGAPLNDAAIAR